MLEFIYTSDAIYSCFFVLLTFLYTPFILKCMKCFSFYVFSFLNLIKHIFIIKNVFNKISQTYTVKHFPQLVFIFKRVVFYLIHF